MTTNIVKIDDPNKDKLFENLMLWFQDDLFPNSRIDREIGEHVNEFIIEKKSNGEYNLTVKLTLEFSIEKGYEDYEPFLKILKDKWKYPEEKKEEKYNLEDILNMSIKELTEAMKKYSHDKYSQIGTLRLNYMEALFRHGLLDHQTTEDYENFHKNKKLAQKALQYTLTTNPVEFREEYEKLISKK